MKIYRTITEYREFRRSVTASLGLVPTLGYLHEGHMSLVRRARAENALCAAWIFVNPMQFGPKEDFGSYPRDEDKDIAMLEKEGVDALFLPDVGEIYPAGFSTHVEVEGVTERLEGEMRPGHFRGVATVVTIFFNIMQPTRAYFGQKDAQQVVVIRKMVRDMNMGIEVVVCPTVRERDGLAMSSRNVYLNSMEREAALALYRSLCLAKERWDGGQRDAGAIKRELLSLLKSEPLAQVDYVSIADTETLEELSAISDKALISLAVRIGKTRLIDNIILGEG